MPEALKNFLSKLGSFFTGEGISDFFSSLTPRKIMALVGGVVAVAGLIYFAVKSSEDSKMSLLYGELELNDSQQIVKKLESLEVPYEVKSDGAQIYVPEDQVATVRLKVAEAGLPTIGSVGYEIFDKSDSIGATSFVQNINKLRALEGELARSIMTIKEIQLARVHLVLPRRELFSRTANKPSASVALRIKKREKLTPEQVQAIQHLVSSAVPQLTPELVAIIDNNGNLLAKGRDDKASITSQTIAELKVTYENRMIQSIESLLEKTVGIGKVRAEVFVEFDMDHLTENSEIFDPEGQVARSTRSIKEHQKQGAPDGTRVTIENQLPQGVGSKKDKEHIYSEKSMSDDLVNYEISKTIRKRIKELGEIKTLSIAVIVDGHYVRQKDGKKVYQPRSPVEMEMISKLVNTAVGARKERGDKVEVVNMRFLPLGEEEEEEEEVVFMGMTKTQLMTSGLLGAVFLGLLFLLARALWRKFFPPPPELSQEELEAEQAVDVEGETAEEVVDELMAQYQGLTEEGEDNMINVKNFEGLISMSLINSVGKLVQEHPERSVAIVRNWLLGGDIYEEDHMKDAG